jgi:hypothetical protein
MSDEDRRIEAIEAVERLIGEFSDVFTNNLAMPVIADWCLVVSHDDMADQSNGGVYRLNKLYQFPYRSAGLLQTATDDYRHVVVEDAD